MLSNINEVNPLIGYQETTHNEPGNRFKGMKAHPTIHKPTTFVNWGLPKSESPMGLCVMRVTSVKNLKATLREMTLKI